MATPLALAAALGLASVETRQASAQPKGPSAEQIRTADGVELHGLFHVSEKEAKSSPVVVFLYPPGPDRDMTKGDWGGLAKMLTKDGYHVFQFDWRGHGKSTGMWDKRKFWDNVFLNGPNSNFNRLIKGGPPKMPLKGDISFKDLPPQSADKYMPAYLMDLAAVRMFLDTKNDRGELNSSSIFIVGAGDAAALGMAWLTVEWKRPAVAPNVQLLGLGATGYEFVPQQLRGNFTEAGTDFAGSVWLTPTRPASIPGSLIQTWISKPTMSPKIRENNPMLFLFADKDTSGARSGKAQASFYYNEVLVAEPRPGSRLEKLDQTFLKEVKGGEQLQGVKLLGQNATLKTEDTILQYFAAIKKARANLPSKTREYKDQYFINLPFFGFTQP
jgi:pimeloyl-ACP methyl ester carboxylesterase